MAEEKNNRSKCENIVLNGMFKKIETDRKNSCCKPCKPIISGKPGNFVPIVDDHIDLVSSTIVNNPIIPPSRPPDNELKNKKYQIIISFDKDRKGSVWPEWMQEPALHALGIESLSGFVSAEIKIQIDEQVIPLIKSVDDKVTIVNENVSVLSNELIGLSSDISSVVFDLSKISNDIAIMSVDLTSISNKLSSLSSEYKTFSSTPASLSSLGPVKSSDKINQISVLNNGEMEVNGLTFSKISQDVDIVLHNPSLEECPSGWNYWNLNVEI